MRDDCNSIEEDNIGKGDDCREVPTNSNNGADAYTENRDNILPQMVVNRHSNKREDISDEHEKEKTLLAFPFVV